jgi:hypothetical protein
MITRLSYMTYYSIPFWNYSNHLRCLSFGIILYMLKSTLKITFNWFKIRVFFCTSVYNSSRVFDFSSQTASSFPVGKRKEIFFYFLDQSQKYFIEPFHLYFHGISSIATSFYFFYRRIKKKQHRTTHIYIFSFFYLILQTKISQNNILPIWFCKYTFLLLKT